VAELSLELIGPFQGTYNGLAIAGLTSDRLRALLAYLAVEADRSHLRPSLAVFFWPEAGYQEACSSLRYALSRLRHALGDPGADAPYLIVSRDALQFNRHSRHRLDVARFWQLAGSHDEADLKAAVALYRGPFLEGISSVDSPAFDEWLLLKREQFDRQMLLVLHRLCAISEQHGDYRQAQAYARRQMEFDPWYEGAHRQMMRALALDGQRGAALSHFHNCQTLLARDLGAEPEDQTVALFESIRAGRLDDAASAAPGDAGEEPLHTPTDTDSPLFVGRTKELATLHRLLDEALDGESRFVFITGSTGSGKTALLRQFAIRALEQHSNLVAVCGSCAPYAGAADICLPFSEILRQLSGDLEIARVQPIYHRDAELRLHEFAPAGLRALVEHGPSLIGPLVSGSALLAQAKTLDPWSGDVEARTHWLNQVQELAKTGTNRVQSRALPGALQVEAYEPASQYSFRGALRVEAYAEATRLLAALARQRPLLLFLDDLQWADADTIALIWHLGRRLRQSPILLVGAYRPGDLANEREATEAAQTRFVHPLEQAVSELQSSFREARIDLDQGEAGGLANTVLDAIPHAFGDAFRSKFARQTGGNPLFACELLRDMQDRGDLVKDSKGKWVESDSVTWTAAPPRLQAVVAKLTANLPAIWREILLAASVQGPVFDAEVVAAACGIDEAQVIRLCSGALSRRFNLVQAVSVDRFPADRHAERTRLSRYRFRAGLCQLGLYRSLDPVRRAELHEAIAQALETLYIHSGTEATYGHALQVALHYEAANMPVEATNRLLQIAQDQDAGDDAAEGLLWPYLGDCRPHAIPMQCAACKLPRRAERNPAAPTRVRAQRDRSTPDEALSYCESLAGGNRTLALLLLQACASATIASGDYDLALDLNHRLLRLARTATDPVRQTAAHWALAVIAIQGGEPVLARRYLEEALQQRVRGLRCTSFHLTGIDMTVHSLAQLAVTLWTLGYPKQALARAHEALNLARQEDSRTQIVALYITGVVLPPLCHETPQARGLVKNLLVLADRENLPAYRLAAEAAQGYDQIVAGDPAKGLARMRSSLGLLESMDAARFTAPLFLHLAEACLRVGDPERGLAALAAGESGAGQFGLGLFEPEILRLMGDLLLAQYAGEAAPMAQAYYERAIQSAAEKEALAWQLRATMSLARLLHNQGEPAEAYARLLPVYTTFTEGCDTPDLNEAGMLLDRLESESAFG